MKIPQAALAQHVIALGKTRSGKSSKLRLLVEQLLDREEPVCIIDPKGDWWGIKSSADGKRAGYPVVIFGGDHADVPLNAHAGAQVAELIATGNRPALIDLGGWMVGERTRFFIDFASTFFKLTRGHRHLVIDEIHNFAPQGKVLDVDAGKMLHWANRLASEGSGKGITLIAASQRPQKVHKDLVTSCETLIACRVIHKLDRDAIKDWIDGCADPTKGKEVLQQLATMQRPEAWVWSPEIDFGPVRMTFPMFKTYDSFKAQEARRGKLKGWAAVDLGEVRVKLERVVKETEANDPKRLRTRIAELERQIAKGSAPALAKHVDLQSAEQRGWKRGYREGADHGLEKGAQLVHDSVLKALHRVKPGHGTMAVPYAPAKALPAIQVTTHPPARDLKPATLGALTSVARVAAARGNGAGGPLPKGERAILGACIQFPDGLKRDQLTVLTGYKRSTRDAYIQRLSEKGYVDVGDRILATDAGRESLPDFEPLPTGIDLQTYWFGRLPEGESKILRVLVERHPDPVQRDELTDITGYKRSTRDAYLQRLTAKELVAETSRGEVRASGDLF